MKKVNKIIIILILVLTLCACSKDKEHKHEFKEQYTITDTHHYFECKSDDCEEKKEYEKHTFNDGEVIEEGNKEITTYTCIKCEYQYTVEKELHKHISNNSKKLYDDEVHYDECLCGEKLNIENHQMGEWIIDIEPTEESTGKKHQTCSGCEYTIEEEIEKLEHVHKAGTTIHEDEKNHWYECLCGEKLNIENHQMGEWIIDIEPTEESTGKKHQTCKTCEYTTEVEIEKLEHTHQVCLKCGLCTAENCNGTSEEKCLGHVEVPSHECKEYKSDWIDESEVPCGGIGYQKQICTECGALLDRRLLVKDHHYESEVIKIKTCTENGEIKYICECGVFYIEKDYAVGHVEDEIKIVTYPTATTLGTKKIGCKSCDYTFRTFNFVDNAYHKNGKLSVVGADLVNQYGEKYQLYGLSTHGLQWFSKVVNFDTFCEIQENFGNNVIRLALYTDEDGYCDGSAAKKQQMLETLHRGIDIATELGLYVIVDWHMVGAENPLDKNPLTYLEEAKEFFSYISNYYKDQNNILYEIMNEPNGSTTWAECKEYANQIIPLIRKNTDAVILVGNPKWTADLNSVMKSPLVGYQNIMYTYHFYAADHKNTSQVVKAYDSGFPVFISEFGFMLSSGDGNISETNGEAWKKVLDTRNISYVAWNISNSKGSASIFKYNTSDLSDVSDANLKEWGVYLKNWYRSKSFKTEAKPVEPTVAEVELIIESESTGFLQCFIVSNGHSTSRLDYDWSSSDINILTISEYSTITIKGDGSCSITCKHKTLGYVGIIDVTIQNGEIINYSSRYTE